MCLCGRISSRCCYYCWTRSASFSRVKSNDQIHCVSGIYNQFIICSIWVLNHFDESKTIIRHRNRNVECHQKNEPKKRCFKLCSNNWRTTILFFFPAFFDRFNNFIKKKFVFIWSVDKLNAFIVEMHYYHKAQTSNTT